MKHFIIFTEYVHNQEYVNKALSSVVDQRLEETVIDDNGGRCYIETEITLGNFLQNATFGGNEKHQLVYVALGDSNTCFKPTASGCKKEMKFVVTNIDYDKKLYQPGELTVTMSVTTTGNDSLNNKELLQAVREFFFNPGEKPATVSVVGIAKYTETGTIEQRMYDMVNIAVRYIVFGFNVFKKKSKLYVTLKCYSPDKKMTLNKYSKVYSGMQFANEIIRNEMIKHYKFYPSELELDVDRLRNLCTEDTSGLYISDTDKKEEDNNTKQRELVQPYLVQYNETFYDFIKRVAVRCGEFLCYREGKFCIGLPHSVTPKTITESVTYTYPEINIESSMALTVDDFVSDYTKIPDEDDRTSDQKKADEEAERRNYVNEIEVEKPLVFVPEYVDDEQMHIMDKNTDYISSRSHWQEVLAYETMGNVLSKSKCIADIAAGFAPAGVEVAKRLITKTSSEKKFESMEEVYPDDVGIKRTDWELAKAGDSKMTQYVIEDSKKEKFLNKFYKNIENAEKTVERGKVDINFSDKLPHLDLTDAVNIDDGIASLYVVSRMYGSYSDEADGRGAVKKHVIEVVPTLNTQLKLDVAKASDTVFMPPHCDIPHTLKATAQEAEVMDVDDPLQIGRVRVKYLWQGSGSALSPWIRVLVPFTGGGGGVFMTPAIHDHVMVNYTSGNIERPYVSGYLYTSECFPSKGATSADKRIDYTYTPRSITSQNGHSITFKDEEPSSFINFLCPPLAAAWNIAGYINDFINERKVSGAKKAYEKAVEEYHNSSDDINKRRAMLQAKYDYEKAKEADRSIMSMEDIPYNPLNGGMVFKDANGMYEVKLSATDRNISIKSPLGDINMSAFTGISISAPNGDVSISGKNVSIVAGNNLDIKSGVNIIDKIPYHFGIAARAAMSALGSTFDPLISTGLGMLSPSAQNIYEEAKNFTDLSFIRNCWEVLMRPVEGTLTIRSKRNVLMTAGLGKAWIPTSLISKTGTALEGGGKWWKLGLSATFGEENNQDLDYLHNKGFVILSLLRYTKQEVKNFYYNFSRQLYHINTLVKKCDDTIWLPFATCCNDDFKANIDIDKKGGMLKAAWDDYKIKGLKGMLADDYTNYSPKKNFYEKIANNYINAYEELRKAVKKFKEFYVDNENSLHDSIGRHWEGDAFTEKKYKAPDAPIVSTSDALEIEIKSADDLAKLIKKPVTIPTGLTKVVMKKCIYEVLRGFDDADYFSIDDEAPSLDAIADDSDEKWQEFIDAIVPYKMTEADKKKAESEKKWNEITNALVAPLASTIGIERNVTKNGQWWSVPGIHELVNWKGAAGPRTYCEYTGAGNILLSNNKGFTYKLDDDAAGFEAMRNPDLDAIKEYLRSLFKNTEPLVIT